MFSSRESILSHPVESSLTVDSESNLFETLPKLTRSTKGRKKKTSSQNIGESFVMNSNIQEISEKEEAQVTELQTKNSSLSQMDHQPEDESFCLEEIDEQKETMSPNCMNLTLSWSLMNQIKSMARSEGIGAHDLIIELVSEGVVKRVFEEQAKPAPSHLMTRNGYVHEGQAGQQPVMSHHANNGNVGNNVRQQNGNNNLNRPKNNFHNRNQSVGRNQNNSFNRSFQNNNSRYSQPQQQNNANRQGGNFQYNGQNRFQNKQNNQGNQGNQGNQNKQNDDFPVDVFENKPK